MEIWDLYDKERVLTGKTVLRGNPVPDGYYHISVHIWIVNSENKFLVQKRAPTKKKFPNMWATTGGAVISGEDGRLGCIREVEEELGIRTNLSRAQIIETKQRKDDFVDVWLIHEDFSIEDLIIQKDEVSEVKWMTIAEIEKLIENNIFSSSNIFGFEKCREILGI